MVCSSLTRTFDTELIYEAVKDYVKYGFNKDEWSGGRNIALLSPAGDLALFEKDRPNVYTGHYFFKVRGKAAIEIAEEALAFVFKEAEVIKGLTPVDNKAAKWMSRRLGFTSYDVVPTIAGDMELFIMTKQDWSNRDE